MVKVDVYRAIEEENKRLETLTEEQAIKNLQRMGILDKKGNVKGPFKGVFVKAQ